MTSGGCVEDRMHWCGHGAGVQSDEVTFVDMPFIGCSENALFVPRLVSVVKKHSDLFNAAPISHSSYYDAFPLLDDGLYLVTNLELFLTEVLFDLLGRVRRSS